LWEGPDVTWLRLLDRNDRFLSTPIAIFLLLSVCLASHGQDASPKNQPEQLDRAIAGLTESIRLKPRDAGLYVARGEAWRHRGDQDKAIDDFNEAIKLDAKCAYAYSARASSWMKKHEPQNAIVDYSAAIELEPRNPVHFLARGDVWSRQGDHAEAIANFNEAVRLAPASPVGYITRALEWEKDLKSDQALADFQMAIAVDPKSVLAYRGRGRILAKRGEYDKLVANFIELARNVPDDPLGHRELAWLLATCEEDAFRNGRRALAEATTACELTRWADHACLDALAAAYAEIGDFDTAFKWQTQALKLFNSKRDIVDRRLRKAQDADMSLRLICYRKRRPFREKPERAGR
jgi:Tfp pilus assembly protein PilF